MTPASRFSPVTLGLAVLAVLSIVLLNAALAGLGDPTTLDELRRFATGTQGVDSWRPMTQARAYLDLGETSRPLYTWLFFEQKVKFIYPPTSLLLLDAMPRASLREALNLCSWLLVVATAAFSALILDHALQGSRHAARSAADRGARIALAALLALCFYPVLKAYSLGQMQVWVNALFAICAFCFVTGRKGVAGVLVALMAAVKPQYGVIAVWGLLRGERRFAAAAFVAGAALLVVSVLRFGWEHHVDYLSVLAHVSRHGEAYWPNQTVNGFLQRLLGNGVSAHWDPHVYPPYHVAVHAGTLLASVLLLGVALFWPVRPELRGGGLDLCAVTLATTIASPIAWEHHYGVLLPAFALLLPALLDAPRAGVGVVLLAAGYGLAANYVHALGRLTDTAWNPLQSLLLFVALAVLAALWRLVSVRRS